MFRHSTASKAEVLQRLMHSAVLCTPLQ